MDASSVVVCPQMHNKTTYVQEDGAEYCRLDFIMTHRTDPILNKQGNF